MNYKNFKIDVDADGIALVTWDMPGRSMNVFDEGALREFDKIVDQVTKDAEIKGAVITSGKDCFSGGADLKMLQEQLAIFARDKGKDLEKATQRCSRAPANDRRVAQAGNQRQAMGRRDQRHLHGRRVRTGAGLPWPRRGGLREGEDGPARSEGRHFPGRRRHPARAAPDRHAVGACRC